MSVVRSQQTAQIEVEGTGEVIEVTCSDLSWQESNEGEKAEGMGTQVLHYAEFEFEGVTATWEVWEYPEGRIELADPPVVRGGTLRRNFDFSLAP
ncbi:MAG TPA: hypothetical protein VK539_02390 [Myxococcaceae bacterium]|nr:hypothetical protein [Myxococcaceae bacterium]